MPGISGPGIRVYPFTHETVGYGFLLEADDARDELFLAPLPTTPEATLQCFVAMWMHRYPGDSLPFVYLVHEADTPTLKAMEGLRKFYARKYPTEEFPLFESNSTEAEILEAVNNVVAEWGSKHPGEPYPRSVEVATEH
jgi:hypothetical protein